jgi:hypothetical protein
VFVETTNLDCARASRSSSLAINLGAVTKLHVAPLSSPTSARRHRLDGRLHRALTRFSL